MERDSRLFDRRHIFPGRGAGVYIPSSVLVVQEKILDEEANREVHSGDMAEFDHRVRVEKSKITFPGFGTQKTLVALPLEKTNDVKDRIYSSKRSLKISETVYLPYEKPLADEMALTDMHVVFARNYRIGREVSIACFQNSCRWA